MICNLITRLSHIWVIEFIKDYGLWHPKIRQFDRKYVEKLHTELMGVAGLLRTPFVGVPFGLKGEATIPLDIARIQPLFGFESRLSNSGSMLRFWFSNHYFAIHKIFTRFFTLIDWFRFIFKFSVNLLVSQLQQTRQTGELCTVEFLSA